MAYSHNKYGLKRRVIFPTIDTMEAAATHADKISFSSKTKIVKMGIIEQDGDIRVSSDTVLDILYWPAGGGTTATLCTKAFTAAAVICATGHSTGWTVDVTLNKNDNITPAVGVIGSDGSFHWYVDIVETFDVADVNV